MARKKKPDKLSQDVSKAIAAGMSYGKWKAMQQPDGYVKPKIEDGWKKCIYCGKPFKPHDKRQKYCESSCQHKANLEKHKERERKRRIGMKG